MSKVYHGFNYIIVENLKDVQFIINSLNSNINRFGETSVADFYSMIGKASDLDDVKHGWTTKINWLEIRQNSNGAYIFGLPEPVVLPRFVQPSEIKDTITFSIPCSDALLKTYINRIGSFTEYRGKWRKVISVKVTKDTMYIELEE